MRGHAPHLCIKPSRCDDDKRGRSITWRFCSGGIGQPPGGGPSSLAAMLKKGTKSRSLRRHLLELALLSLIPAAIFSAVVVYALWKAQERERIAIQFQTVQALAGAVEGALAGAIRRTRLLGKFAGSSDTSAFEQTARLVLQESADWSNVILLSPTGEQVFNLAAGPGDVLPSIDRAEHREARQLNKVVLTDVFVSPRRGKPVVNIIAPLDSARYEGYLLLVSLDLAYFDRLISHKDQPAGSLTSLLDANKRIIARSAEADARRGNLIREDNLRTLQGEREGTARIRTIEGLRVYNTWTTINNGWTVTYGPPASAIEAPLKQSLVLLAGSWLLAFGLGLALALRKQRRLARYFHMLLVKADSVEGGWPIRFAESDIDELNQVLRKLHEARGALQEALEREREAREAAEHANNAKDRFLAMLGHELRTPLAAISSATHVMASDRATHQDREKAFNIISRQTRHLTAMVNELLDVSRAVTGKIKLQRQPINLGETARHVLEAHEVSGVLSNHTVIVDVADVWIDADKTRLEQVVQNLLANAATYTPHGNAIQVRVRRDNDEALFQVADAGVGISQADLPHVFDLFFQAEQDVHRPYSGLGIGLTLVKSLVEMHGGTVAVHSPGRGKGTTFTVKLPATHVPPIGKCGSAHHDCAPQKILIVEDNADTRESLKRVLALAGHEVEEAADAPEALSILCHRQPDVALLDIGLPGMDGHDLAREIRNRHGAAISLVAVTGYGLESDIERSLAAGFDAHLTKPLDFDVLHDVIWKNCRKRSTGTFTHVP